MDERYRLFSLSSAWGKAYGWRDCMAKSFPATCPGVVIQA